MNKAPFFCLMIILSFNFTSCAMDIFAAIRANDCDRVLQLIQANPTIVNAREGALQNTPLHVVGHGNNVGMARILLEHGADLNALNLIGETPLDSSVGYWCDVDCVMDSDIVLLLDHCVVTTRVAQIKDALIAFVSAFHPRLGENSRAHCLPRELFPLICEKAYALSHEGICKIARQEIAREEEERKKRTKDLLMYLEERRVQRSQQDDSRQRLIWSCTLL